MFIFLQSFHYERDDVALPGMAKFFRKNSDEEREHAQKFMKVICLQLAVIISSNQKFQLFSFECKCFMFLMQKSVGVYLGQSRYIWLVYTMI